MPATKAFRPYTQEEDAFIRANYKKGGLTIKQIAKKLDRGQYAIEKFLRARKIYKEIHRPWTEDDVEILRTNYNGKVPDIMALAGRLRRTFWSVEGKAGSLGMTRIKRHFWTEKELEFLRENTGKYNVRKIANLLHRSENAIILQMKTMKLHRKNRNGWYTTTEAAEIIGCSRQKITWLIRDNKLHAVPHYDSEHSVLEITREALKKFICKYPAELQGRPVDIVQLIDVLVPNGIVYNLDVDAS